MRRTFLWINFVLASLIVLLIFAAGVLDRRVHRSAAARTRVRSTRTASSASLFIHGFELLVFLTAFGAWPRAWRWIGVTFCLFVVGTVQIFLVPSDDEAVSGQRLGPRPPRPLALLVLVYAA